MLLRLWDQRAVVDDGAVCDDAHAVVDRDSCRDEIAVGIFVAGADFRKLTGAAGDGVLMTVCAGPGVEDRTQSGLRIVSLLEPGLVKPVVVARELCDAVAGALRTRVLRERRGLEAGRRLGCRLLRTSGDADSYHSKDHDKNRNVVAPHDVGHLKNGVNSVI